MTVEVEKASHHPGDGRAVSGPVVKVLMGLVHAHSGDVGVAQALALAGEGRSFLELNNPATRSTLAETVALFNAAALVIGDGAIGLHVGDLLLSAPSGDALMDQLLALGSPGEVFRHVEPLVAQFETTSEAEALEVADDHALVQVVPLGAPWRHAHLCEMTRGLLAQVPALWALGPTLVTETECSARGGRRCLYALSWDDDPAESSEVPPPGSSVDHPVAALQHGSHNGAGGGPSSEVRD
ncbi:MAG TPA: hypothetical protein VG054_09755, partial [Acidimicrobiales bacterium]|nr:hypothetical protein [Acidimicrobiales bacterium]